MAKVSYGSAQSSSSCAGTRSSSAHGVSPGGRRSSPKGNDCWGRASLQSGFFGPAERLLVEVLGRRVFGPPRESGGLPLSARWSGAKAGHQEMDRVTPVSTGPTVTRMHACLHGVAGVTCMPACLYAPAVTRMPAGTRAHRWSARVMAPPSLSVLGAALAISAWRRPRSQRRPRHPRDFSPSPPSLLPLHKPLRRAQMAKNCENVSF